MYAAKQVDGRTSTNMGGQIYVDGRFQGVGLVDNFVDLKDARNE